MAEPWKNESRLYEDYVVEQMTQAQMADDYGCSRKTIRSWMKKFGIERRDPNEANGPWTDKDRLKRDYQEKNLILTEMASKYGCSKGTVIRWMDLFGIDRNGKPPVMRHDSNGYEVFNYTKSDGQMAKIYHHRLLAVAEYGFDEVCDKDVHHRNEVPWDNRPKNLEPLTKSEHRSLHSRQE
jgi:DNA-binding XRE family transcriptional regulator